MHLLDTDLYKFSMQQAIGQHYPQAEAEYELIVRTPVAWPAAFAQLRSWIDEELVAAPALTESEVDGLGRVLPVQPWYRSFLARYRFDPSEIVECSLDEERRLRLIVRGPWLRTVLWEVPLMALISERYHLLSHGGSLPARDADVVNRAAAKGLLIRRDQLPVVEGGTRRRFSREIHQRVLAALNIPTSNVGMALEMGLPCVGTVAHEWTMYHGAILGYEEATAIALDRWVETYRGALGIGLLDTYTTPVFLRAFNGLRARIYDGVRQDSGDPLLCAQQVIAHYERLGIDPRSKVMVFSDGLGLDDVQAIRSAMEGRIGARFLLGTSLTCDVPGVRPLNMVIKMTRARAWPTNPWRPAVKLSDVPTKHSGDPEEVERCKQALGLVGA
ncbi:MAG: nicotinate phosphoribosyltransferase [bacterium]